MDNEVKISEVARYLASYLESKQDLFLKYSPKNGCDIVQGEHLEKIIQEFYDNMY